MPVDNRIVTRPELGADVSDPFKSRHDIATTQDSVQQLLAGGTPDWVKHPLDYKNFVRESFAAEKEISDEMSERYKMEDQEDLTNAAARMVNPMSTRDFIAKLRANGIKCFTVDNGFPPKTVALWCIPLGQHARARYICYLQVPAQWEWSVLKVDHHGKPIGEDYRGWRTVLIQLIEKEILTEESAHNIFGKPSTNSVFSRYWRSLWEHRNYKRYTEKELVEKDV
jgi:hypothetical protein